MVGYAAAETFPGAEYGQAGDPGPSSGICPQMLTLSSGL